MRHPEISGRRIDIENKRSSACSLMFELAPHNKSCVACGVPFAPLHSRHPRRHQNCREQAVWL